MKNSKLSKLNQKIFKIIAPNHWEVDNPNEIAKNNAFKICQKFIQKKIWPKVITATIEEGVYIEYKKGPFSLSIETYNDGSVAAVINNDIKKIIIHSEKITDLNIENIYHIFEPL